MTNTEELFVGMIGRTVEAIKFEEDRAVSFRLDDDTIVRVEIGVEWEYQVAGFVVTVDDGSGWHTS